MDNASDVAPNAAPLGAPEMKVGAALRDVNWNGIGGFPSDVQVRAALFTAAAKIGVREQNRPEDVEWNPLDPSGTPRLYVAASHDSPSRSSVFHLVSSGWTNRFGALYAALVRSAVREWLDGCADKLRTGVLTEADLRRGASVLEAECATCRTQTLLYLYSKSTNLRSPLGAWALYDPAAADEPVLPSQDAPYASVLDAVRDGWRIVQFPRPELHRFSDLDNAYLGFEFILEK